MAKARWYGRRTVERTRKELRASSPADQGATDRCSRTPALAALAMATLVDANDANDAENAKKDMVYAVAVAEARAGVRVRILEAVWRIRGSGGDQRPSIIKRNFESASRIQHDQCERRRLTKPCSSDRRKRSRSS